MILGGGRADSGGGYTPGCQNRAACDYPDRPGRPRWNGQCGIMDIYMHARVLFTIIAGLGVSRLLIGLVRIVQHRKEYKVYWVHPL